MSDCRLILGDCLDVLRTLEPGSVDAVVTDPPYFRVKGESWDRQWDDADAFLSWLGRVVDELVRVLASNGSLYLFAAPRMAARVECLIAEWLNVLSHIVWVKADGYHKAQYKEGLRNWFPQTERIIFAEHYGADSTALGVSGYAAKCEEARQFVFEPLRSYLAGEFAALGWNADDLNRICGTASMAGRHYVARSQWSLPTATHYAKLQAAAGGRALRREYEDLRREYEDLRREYEDLRREYEDLRRPFRVTASVPYTDVWSQFPTVGYYPGKHPCEKPTALMEHIITASTRPGALVLDPFLGSGSTGVAAKTLGRRFIGIEQSATYIQAAERRIGDTVATVLPYPVRHEPPRTTIELLPLFDWAEARA